MTLSGYRLKDLKSPYISYIRGPLETEISSASAIENPKDNSLVFISKTAHLESLKDRKNLIVIALEKLEVPEENSFCWFSTPSIQAAMATSLPFLEDKPQRFFKGIHPTAVISPSAQVHPTAHIGPYSVVGDHVKIGQGTIIGPQCVIERQAEIGQDCLLHAQVFIGARCKLGNQCEIHPNTTIGSDGFGYVQDPSSKVRHKIPQIGIVVVEDNVEIGAGCAIDRATLGETRIGQGTKLDNLVHIGHNNKIGKHNAITAGFGMAGTSEIGDNCVFGGHTAIADHIKICNDVVIGGKSGVTGDITEPGAYVGYPVVPMPLGMKIMASLSALPEIRKQMKLIMRHLNLK